MVIIPNKDNVLDLDDLGEMVRDINAEYVSKEEILSDKVIKCDNCGNTIGQDTWFTWATEKTVALL